MNYLDIVLQGYFNDNNREFLEKYFAREYKKAENEQFFEADEFFNGCIKVTDSWEKKIQDDVLKRKKELYLMLNGAKNKTLNYGNVRDEGIEQKRLETIEYCQQELKDVRPDGIGSISFTLHLNTITNGRITHNMQYNEVLYIKKSILKAFSKTKQQAETPTTQQNEKQNLNFNDNMDAFNSPHDGTFTVSKIKSKLRLEGGAVKHVNTRENNFDLANTNLYNKITGELIEEDTQASYNTAFLIRLSEMFTPNVKPFLTHQLNGSLKQSEFIEYVRYCSLHSEIIKHSGTKEAIRDWLAELEFVEQPKAFNFKNTFDSVDEDKIYKHFKNGLVDSRMLTEKEFEDYLKVAFEKQIKPNSLFNLKHAPAKNKVMKIFYLYYLEVAGKPHGKQKEYASLLGEYFQGYKTDTVRTNFSKSIY